ncbi:FAD-dependent oxidoreductase [Mesorhizobium sp. B3-1-3]|uniref:FAD-dependent oxidoreductase n=1 Tax=unclassified Mesorhizobium TaxID=325217 RepID=UPI001128EDF5|nr:MULTISPECIES: FAD-dependent oxidoreductase [unclassified Mesorhizobium]TPI56046.1 FAD-dependent oxidoreductase [Mesorhizobium sp. B3-1-8]TPI63340.1 FAD-dependent oxidoreductase [Mesorhizobium sp. B3-1-3]
MYVTLPNGYEKEFDVIVAGSGSAGCAAALTAAVQGLSVGIFEKGNHIGGTSGMSGAGCWMPANRLAAAAGVSDSPEEALEYLRATAPAGWADTFDPLWRQIAFRANEVLELVEANTPVRFSLCKEPDPYADAPGGKQFGRMMSPRPLKRRLLGKLGRKLHRSYVPPILTYQEFLEGNFYHHPFAFAFMHARRVFGRVLRGEVAMGAALIIGLLRGCLDHGVKLHLNSPVVELLKDGTGKVTGVTANIDGKLTRISARKGVVLATGGFEWDKLLFSEHFPGPTGHIASPITNTGDGHRLAEAAGASLANMNQVNLSACLPAIHEGRLKGIPLMFHVHPHAIVVNRKGRRFTSEYGYGIGDALDGRDADGYPLHTPAWVIADARFLRNSAVFRWFARKRPGWILTARTLPDLALKTNLPSGTLLETVARYNSFCDNGCDPDFHRGEPTWERYKAGSGVSGQNNALGRIERAPYIALAFNRSVLGTKGGVMTNEEGQALRGDGTVIPGLYCAGLTMANSIGTRAVSSGTTIGPNLVYGYVCGRSLARRDL